jgi:uracil-DNA glycosylase family 4
MNQVIKLKLPTFKVIQPTSTSDLEDHFRAHASDLGLVTQVFSEGPINASIAIVGEGPGESEVAKGRPFIGGSGRLLFENLKAIGLHRTDVYTTNVVKRQISLSRHGDERNVVKREEFLKWTDLLEWELGRLPHLKTILIMGNFALNALLGEEKITQWRGSVVQPARIPGNRMGTFVCTINPAYAMRELKLEPVFTLDIRNKLGAVLKGAFKPYEIKTTINPSYREARRAIKDIKEARKPTALDIEWIAKETACIGFANDPHNSVCINWRDDRSNRYTLQEEADILYDIQDLCDSHKANNVPLIGQNAQFDTYALRLKDWLSVSFSDDTLLQHHTLYPQLPHSLGFLTSQYTTHPYYKDEVDSWKEGGNIDDFWRYNGKDTCITLRCWERMCEELKSQDLWRFYREHVMRAHPHLVAATIHGVKVDLQRKEQLVKLISEDVQGILQKFHDCVHQLTGNPFYDPNPGSWQQMKELYFNRLKLKGRGTSTDEANRIQMLKNPETPALAKEMITYVGKYAEEAKFLGTYADSKVGDDGRFRSEYKQNGVQKAPGRLSSASLLDGQGGNMQNQPVRAREMYLCDDGMVFGYFDLSQAEARVVGWRAGITKWQHQFEKARMDGIYDCHRALASDMFKVPYDAVPTYDHDDKDKPTIRYIAKRCRHGLNYRMERYKLSEVTGLSYNEANRNFIIYHSTTPELEKWWDIEERNFRKHKEVYNALGRRFKVIQRIDDEVLKSIVAFYPQSTIGDKITQVWYQSESDDGWPDDARVAIDVHDNLVCIASPATIKSALKIMCKYAEQPIPVRNVFTGKIDELIIPAEAKVSYPVSYVLNDKGKWEYVEDPKGVHRWSHLKKVKL